MLACSHVGGDGLRWGGEEVGAGGRGFAVGTGCAVDPGRVLTVVVETVGAVAEGHSEDLRFVGAGAEIAPVGVVLVVADIWRL